jgi:hypothetical protein
MISTGYRRWAHLGFENQDCSLPSKIVSDADRLKIFKKKEFFMEENKNDNIEQEKGSSPISLLFQRVVTDDDFKKLLIENPDEALKDYELTEAQIMIIKNLDKEDIEKLTPENIEEFFSADAAVYTPDEAEAIDEESYSPEDFEDFEDEYEKDDTV